MFRFASRLLALVFAGYAVSSPAYAAYDQDDAKEPPLIAGRLTVADGNVQIWRTDEDNDSYWDEAQVNDVVTVNAGLFTGPDSRAEVRWGPHAVRLGPYTRGGFSLIDYDNAVFNLERGTLALRLRDDSNDRVAVTVAGMRVDLKAPGRYRIDALDGRPLQVTVFAGGAGLQSASNSLSIGPSQALDVGPNGSSFSFTAPVATSFDEWSLRRDEAVRGVHAVRYVSPYMTGYEDLDDHGEWAPDATYGTVWYPRAVPVGWVPYRYGRWRWVSPWGWTWVDDMHWGFAPFHYGRWVVIGGRWCWWPGQRIVHPVYAPALVGWVGSPGWSVSISVGGPAYVGWYPLAPWHAYQPRYTTNVTYVTQINQIIIHQPPRGVPPELNLRDGRTIVPGHGFREPIRRVIRPGAPVPDPRELRPVAPPPPKTGWVPTPRIEHGPAWEAPKRSAPANPALAPGRVVPSNQAVPAPQPGRVPTPRIERGPAVQEPKHAVPPAGPAPNLVAPAPQPGRMPTPRVERGPAVQEPKRPTPPPQFAPSPQPGRLLPTPRVERGPATDENQRVAPPKPVVPIVRPPQSGGNPPMHAPPPSRKVAPEPAAPRDPGRGDPGQRPQGRDDKTGRGNGNAPERQNFMRARD